MNPDGSVVFEARDIDIPAQFSQVATDIMAQKYFRKAGVPAETVAVAEDGVPEWLQRRVPAADTTMGGETDAKQTFHRLAGMMEFFPQQRRVHGRCGPQAEPPGSLLDRGSDRLQPCQRAARELFELRATGIEPFATACLRSGDLRGRRVVRKVWVR